VHLHLRLICIGLLMSGFAGLGDTYAADDPTPERLGNQQKSDATAIPPSKAAPDLPSPEVRLMVTDDGLGPLTFGARCDRTTVAAAVPGAEITVLRGAADSDGVITIQALRGGTLVLEVRSDPRDGSVAEFTARSSDVVDQSGMRIGQDYERAMSRTRYRCASRAGTGDLAGTYVCSFAERPHLSYVFAPRGWTGADASPVVGSMPPPDVQLVRIVWRAR